MKKIEPIFTAKDTGISARLINHWTHIGLIKQNKDGKWHRFSLDEIVELKVVALLRDFGFFSQCY